LISQSKTETQAKRFGGRNGFAVALVVMACVLVPGRLSAQIKSNVASVNLNATLNSSITIVAAPGLVNFTLPRNGIANGSATVGITTSWALPVIIGRISEYAYFTSAGAALSDGASDNIPSASVSASANGAAYTPFTGASPFAAGSSMTLFNQFILILLNTSSSRTDTLNLRIDTTGLNLPAGTYTGVLHIQAQAI
jgi:hypothetical protein